MSGSGIFHSINLLVKGVNGLTNPVKEASDAMKSFRSTAASTAAAVNGMKIKSGIDGGALANLKTAADKMKSIGDGLKNPVAFKIDVSQAQKAAEAMKKIEKNLALGDKLRGAKSFEKFDPLGGMRGAWKSAPAPDVSWVEKLAKKFPELEGAAKKAAARLDEVGKKAMLVGAASAAGFGVAAKKASSFETAVAEVSTLVDTSKVNIADLTTKARAMSNEFGVAPTETVKSLYTVISAGFTDASDAAVLLRGSLKLGKAGLADVGVTIDGLTSVLNAYGMKAGEVTKLSDQMFIAVMAGKTTINELAGSLGKVSPLASAAGMGTDQMLAAVATLTLGGMSTAESVTALRSALANVIKPTEEAKQTAASLGLNFNVAAIKSMGFAAWMEHVKNKTKGSSLALSQLFGDVQGLAGVMALTGPQMGQLNDVLGQIQKSSGATEVAFKKIEATSEEAFNRAKASVGNLAIDIGAALLPTLGVLLGGVSSAAQAFSRFSEAHPALSKTIVIIGAVAAGALFLGGAFLWLAAQAVTASAAIGISLSAAIWPVTLVVLAIGAVIAAVVVLASYWSDISDGIVVGAKAVGSAFVAIGGFIWDGIKAVGSFFYSLGGYFYDAGTSLINTFADGIRAGWASVKSSFGGILSWVDRQMNHSDAKEGPLKAVSKSGLSLMSTWAKGIELGADIPLSSLQSALEPIQANLNANVEQGASSSSAQAAAPSGAVFHPGAIQITINGSKDDLNELEEKITALFSRAAAAAG